MFPLAMAIRTVGEFKAALGIRKQLALAFKYIFVKVPALLRKITILFLSEKFLHKISFMHFPSFIKLGSFSSLVIMLIAS
jgi:hypothetical protein